MDTFLSDENHEHMVMPGMVYISQPTEYGTLYSLEELTVSARPAADTIFRFMWTVQDWHMHWLLRKIPFH